MAHANVVRLLNVFVDNECLVLVLELVRGSDLLEVRSRAPVSGFGWPRPTPPPPHPLEPLEAPQIEVGSEPESARDGAA